MFPAGIDFKVLILMIIVWDPTALQLKCWRRTSW